MTTRRSRRIVQLKKKPVELPVEVASHLDDCEHILFAEMQKSSLKSIEDMIKAQAKSSVTELMLQRDDAFKALNEGRDSLESFKTVLSSFLSLYLIDHDRDSILELFTHATSTCGIADEYVQEEYIRRIALVIQVTLVRRLDMLLEVKQPAAFEINDRSRLNLKRRSEWLSRNLFKRHTASEKTDSFIDELEEFLYYGGDGSKQEQEHEKLMQHLEDKRAEMPMLERIKSSETTTILPFGMSGWWSETCHWTSLYDNDFKNELTKCLDNATYAVLQSHFQSDDSRLYLLKLCNARFYHYCHFDVQYRHFENSKRLMPKSKPISMFHDLTPEIPPIITRIVEEILTDCLYYLQIFTRILNEHEFTTFEKNLLQFTPEREIFDPKIIDNYREKLLMSWLSFFDIDNYGFLTLTADPYKIWDDVLELTGPDVILQYWRAVALAGVDGIGGVLYTAWSSLFQPAWSCAKKVPVRDIWNYFLKFLSCIWSFLKNIASKTIQKLVDMFKLILEMFGSVTTPDAFFKFWDDHPTFANVMFISLKLFFTWLGYGGWLYLVSFGFDVARKGWGQGTLVFIWQLVYGLLVDLVAAFLITSIKTVLASPNLLSIDGVYAWLRNVGAAEKQELISWLPETLRNTISRYLWSEVTNTVQQGTTLLTGAATNITESLKKEATEAKTAIVTEMKDVTDAFRLQMQQLQNQVKQLGDELREQGTKTVSAMGDAALSKVGAFSSHAREISRSACSLPGARLLTGCQALPDLPLAISSSVTTVIEPTSLPLPLPDVEMIPAVNATCPISLPPPPPLTPYIAPPPLTPYIQPPTVISPVSFSLPSCVTVVLPPLDEVVVTYDTIAQSLVKRLGDKITEIGKQAMLAAPRGTSLEEYKKIARAHILRK